MNSVEIPSDTTLLFRIEPTIALSVTFCGVARITNSDNWDLLSSNIMSKVKSDIMFISFENVEYPRYDDVTLYNPGLIFILYSNFSFDTVEYDVPSECLKFTWEK